MPLTKIRADQIMEGEIKNNHIAEDANIEIQKIKSEEDNDENGDQLQTDS